jgi:hypothetical protein
MSASGHKCKRAPGRTLRTERRGRGIRAESSSENGAELSRWDIYLRRRVWVRGGEATYDFRRATISRWLLLGLFYILKLWTYEPNHSIHVGKKP